MQPVLNEELMVDIYQILKTQSAGKSFNDLQLLKLTMKIYKQLSTMNLAEKERVIDRMLKEGYRRF